MSKQDERHDITIDAYVATLDDAMHHNARQLMNVMHNITRQEPILYGIGTIGFGVYKYEYASGRKGEAHTLAFYSRNSKITIYLMDGTSRYAALLSRLGVHSITGYCIYIKQLSDINISVLTSILEASYHNIETKLKVGPIDHILWQSNK